MKPLTLAALNAAPLEAAAHLLAGVYEDAPWVAAQALAQRPFATLAQLKYVLTQAVATACAAEQLALIRRYPPPGSGAAAAPDAGAEPGAQPIDAPTLARLDALTAAYAERFGFPFVLALAGPRGIGLCSADIIATCERRLHHHPAVERAEALHNIHRIAELRLNARFGFVPELGNTVWDWHEALAVHSDPGWSEQGQLTVTYLSDAHRRTAAQIAAGMRACGFDSVHIDAVGNVVGRYDAVRPGARALLTGSHYDTVRNAGKYDGRLGIFVPMACVRALSQARRRLPCAIEVVGFAEEEGQRYKATFLGSGALVGQFNAAWLEQKDSEGVSMRQAMQNAGLRIEDIPSLRRDPAQYLAFVEVHIEQGPVLYEVDLPLGIVTSINGSVRYVGEVAGMASHAGTTPMQRRHDAACAVAELVLAAERRAAREPGGVATVGMLEVPGGSINVVPGRCRFSLDIRAPQNTQRDAMTADILAELQAICARRQVHSTLEETLRASAAPSDPAWQRRWEEAVAALGVPLFHLPSGAGHDAMKLHEVMPQAMLFVRGIHSGISHNPLEMSTSDDMQLAVQAMQNLLDGLARDLLC